MGSGVSVISADDDVAALRNGADGADACFHAAAHVAGWGPWEAVQRGTVDGSRNPAEACLRAGARRLVHVEFRDFVTRRLATAGVEALDRALPVPVARALAAASEWAWRVLPLPGAPPMARLAPWLLSLERTVDDSRARAELATSP